MIARFLLPLLAVALPTFGQTGLYGPVTTHIKAGDPAPDITFTRLLNAPVSASWSQSNLTGQLTVVMFFPLPSPNPQTIDIQAVDIWNTVVEKFSGKPVQFLFITGEKGATLKPFLNDHPIKGWVFLDPDGKTGNAYSLEQPVIVYIGPDRKILGFRNFPMADERTINAALEHRIATTHPTEATIQAFMANNQVALDAEPRRMLRFDDNKPNFPPSNTLHVTPSSDLNSSYSSSDTFLSLKSKTLTNAIRSAYDDINPVRIQLPATIDNHKSYDFALVLPQPESREKMNALFQQGILDYFHLTARRESHLVDVYVLTNDPNHPPPPVKPLDHTPFGHTGSFGISFEATHIPGETPDMRKAPGIDAIRSLSASGTVDEFCHMLESSLDRPIVNETNLHDQYFYNLTSTEGSQNDFLQRLRNQLGLIITPSKRVVEILVFEPR